MFRSPASASRHRGALIAVALVAGVLSAPAFATTAYAGAAASITLTEAGADAAPAPVLYVGVRQAAVGDPIPVSIVGAAAGSVWDVSIVAPATLVGTVTIADDGTGTTLVSLPMATDPGSVELVAANGGVEISTSVSSGGDSSPAAAPEAVGLAHEEPGVLDGTLLIVGGAIAGGIALAGAAVAMTARRRSTRAQTY